MSALPILSSKWEIVGLGDLPLDTIFLKNEIANHLLNDDVGNDDPKPEDLFGARYAFEIAEELFSDKDVAVAVDNEADSQEGLSELA